MDWISYLNKVSSNGKTKSTPETKAREIPKQSQITSKNFYNVPSRRRTSNFGPHISIIIEEHRTINILRTFFQLIGLSGHIILRPRPLYNPSQTHDFQSYLHGAQFSMSDIIPTSGYRDS